MFIFIISVLFESFLSFLQKSDSKCLSLPCCVKWKTAISTWIWLNFCFVNICNQFLHCSIYSLILVSQSCISNKVCLFQNCAKLIFTVDMYLKNCETFHLYSQLSLLIKYSFSIKFYFQNSMNILNIWIQYFDVFLEYFSGFFAWLSEYSTLLCHFQHLFLYVLFMLAIINRHIYHL